MRDLHQGEKEVLEINIFIGCHGREKFEREDKSKILIRWIFMEGKESNKPFENQLVFELTQEANLQDQNQA